ncbi:Ureide permease 1 isoform 4 [Dorcoceras hygrometricum]|uniref:Ureide permease 1 isoform 4 n=1 Tax=Dorcoceras hygrometricum TaxID=472368 RepID=A0A2Z7CT08_9LAMI|nr:Ureide permease 1 isoform 4 [Dorcoceras hygrometricum]
MTSLLMSSTLNAPAELSPSADCDDITADVIIADSRSCASSQLLIVMTSSLLLISSSRIYADVITADSRFLFASIQQLISSTSEHCSCLLNCSSSILLHIPHWELPSQKECIWRIEDMYLVESKGGAIACMLLALLFLGTWPALLTLLERRGRLPQHTYLDFTMTNLLAAVIFAFTFGEIGRSTTEQPNFLAQLYQDNWPSVLFAMAGGIVLSLGNLATQYAWAFVGLSVTEVITSSITVVIGTTVNYFLDDKINKAVILFPGVGCFLIAVCLGSAVHSSNAADNKKSLVLGKGTFTGLAITFFAGICFSLFSPAFNLATNDQWLTLKNGVPHLTVYTAFFYFSVSSFLIALILNVSFLYFPLLDLPKSSFKAYLSDWNGRGWALWAGLLCGFGNGLQFMGGQAAGYAAADAVQALPLVSTFWGVVLFGEYRRSSRRTYILLWGMLSMFIVAVGMLMASSGHRGHRK